MPCDARAFVRSIRHIGYNMATADRSLLCSVHSPSLRTFPHLTEGKLTHHHPSSVSDDNSVPGLDEPCVETRMLGVSNTYVMATLLLHYYGHANAPFSILFTIRTKQSWSRNYSNWIYLVISTNESLSSSRLVAGSEHSNSVCFYACVKSVKMYRLRISPPIAITSFRHGVMY